MSLEEIREENIVYVGPRRHFYAPEKFDSFAMVGVPFFLAREGIVAGVDVNFKSLKGLEIKRYRYPEAGFTLRYIFLDPHERCVVKTSSDISSDELIRRVIYHMYEQDLRQ